MFQPLNLRGLFANEKQIHISKFFDWFEKDFKVTSGVEDFISLHRTDLPDLEIDTDIDYNWNVNGNTP